jgi:hypothetical protein
VQTPDGAQRAIDAGVYMIAHNSALTPEHHRQMAEKGIYLAGTDTPFTPYRGSETAFKRTVANLRDAWEKKVPLTYSTDMDYWMNPRPIFSIPGIGRRTGLTDVCNRGVPESRNRRRNSSV